MKKAGINARDVGLMRCEAFVVLSMRWLVCECVRLGRFDRPKLATGVCEGTGGRTLRQKKATHTTTPYHMFVQLLPGQSVLERKLHFVESIDMR